MQVETRPNAANQHGLHAMRRVLASKNSKQCQQSSHVRLKSMRNEDFELPETDSRHFVNVALDSWQPVGSRWCKSAGPSQLACLDERPKRDRILFSKCWLVAAQAGGEADLMRRRADESVMKWIRFRWIEISLL